MRADKFKGKNSLKALENPNYDKIVKGAYNKTNKLTKGEFGKTLSKPEYINHMRTSSKDILLAKNKPLKGEMKSIVDTVNKKHGLK